LREKEMLAADGFHMGDKGYDRLAARVAQHLDSLRCVEGSGPGSLGGRLPRPTLTERERFGDTIARTIRQSANLALKRVLSSPGLQPPNS
jgi:hypothetical protein